MGADAQKKDKQSGLQIMSKPALIARARALAVVSCFINFVTSTQHKFVPVVSDQSDHVTLAQQHQAEMNHKTGPRPSEIKRSPPKSQAKCLL